MTWDAFFRKQGVVEIVARDLPYLSLFTKVNVAVLPAGLVGYRHYPSGELHSLRTMHWAERELPDRQKTDREPRDRERIGPP